jgi:glycosyltransferase domain-containing protein
MAPAAPISTGTGTIRKALRIAKKTIGPLRKHQAVRDFTLLIPTYNRPQQLAGLLGYLEAEGADCRIVVLDSSAPENIAINRERTAKSPLEIEHVEFPSETLPFDKFRAGASKVTTPFGALCADDDLIIIDGVRQCLAVLRENPCAAVVQGYCFAFLCQPNGDMDLQNILYFTPTIDDATPLARLARLFARYQATTYGIYRAPVLQRIFHTVAAMKSILARELLGSALAAIEGQIVRLPCWTHGRSMDASESYEHWHPLEWFVKDPQDLFCEFQSYRELMAAAVIKSPDNRSDAATVQRILDLIHLNYLVKHAPEGAVEFIIDQQLSGASFQSYWPRPEIHIPLSVAAGFDNRTARLSSRLYRQLHSVRFALRMDGGWKSNRAHRRKRLYHQYPNFAAPKHTNQPEPENISQLLESLDNYRLATPARRYNVTISVLLCNYNDSRFLPDSLGAICTQTRPPDEVVVVDDGSTDNSVEIIQSFARRYPFVRLVRNEQNRGLIYSINRALGEARSQFVVWAAADDRLLPNFLERNIECLIQNPSAQMTVSRLATFRNGSEEVFSYTEKNHGAAFDFGDAPKFLSPEELRERLRKSYVWLSGNAAVVSRTALVQAGAFDEKLRWHADYFSYWVVALRHGVCLIPETLALMRQHETTYSSAGMSNPGDQRQVLSFIADKLTTKGWRDIGVAVFQCPSLLSPMGVLMLKVLLLTPRHWPHAVSCGLWWTPRLLRDWLNNRRRLRSLKHRARRGTHAVSSGLLWPPRHLPDWRNNRRRLRSLMYRARRGTQAVSSGLLWAPRHLRDWLNNRRRLRRSRAARDVEDTWPNDCGSG